MSSLAWIDFDEAERQRAQRIMARFQKRESRDELGLGAIVIRSRTTSFRGRPQAACQGVDRELKKPLVCMARS